VQYDNYRKTLSKKFIFGLRVHHQGTRLKFVYEGHRVKVKVTVVKTAKLPTRNVKLQSAIAPVL